MKEIVIVVTTPVVFVWMKEGSTYTQLVHSAAQFGGDPFNPVEYQSKFTGFVGDRIMGVNPMAILIKAELWNWTKSRVVNNIVKLTSFFDVSTNRGLMYIPKQSDTTEEAKVPMLLLIPVD